MTGLTIEVLPRRLMWLPMVKSQRANAGITANVEGGPKVLGDNRLVSKMHLFAISFGGLRCVVNIFPIRIFLLLQSTSVPVHKNWAAIWVMDYNRDISRNEAELSGLQASPATLAPVHKITKRVTGRESMYFHNAKLLPWYAG